MPSICCVFSFYPGLPLVCLSIAKSPFCFHVGLPETVSTGTNWSLRWASLDVSDNHTSSTALFLAFNKITVPITVFKMLFHTVVICLPVIIPVSWLCVVEIAVVIERYDTDPSYPGDCDVTRHSPAFPRWSPQQCTYGYNSCSKCVWSIELISHYSGLKFSFCWASVAACE